MMARDERQVTYAAAPARVWGPLLTRRRVDAVDVDVALLLGDLVHDLLALRRGLGQGAIVQANLQPAV